MRRLVCRAAAPRHPPPSAAHAAPVTSFADLVDAVDTSCDDGDTVVLGSTIHESDTHLVVSCSLTLDINGNDLSVPTIRSTADSLENVDGVGGGKITAVAPRWHAAIETPSGSSLVIDADIDAVGGDYSAAIGGGDGLTTGDIKINGGTINAVGGSHSPGVGAGYAGPLGAITITGGTVTATGGEDGSGLGGAETAYFGPGTVEIVGGTVTATGGQRGAGIGAGAELNGGEVTIGAGAVVTAVGGAGASAIGHGAGGDEFGSLSIAGTLHLPEGFLEIPDVDDMVEVAPTGRVLGGTEDVTDGAELIGDGLINNGGAITLSDDLVLDGGITVVQHHHLVNFADADDDPLGDPVVLFAPTLDDGARDFPDAPAPEGMQLTGWVTQEGQPVDGDTVLVDVAGAAWQPTENGEPVADTLYPVYEPIPVDDEDVVEEDEEAPGGDDQADGTDDGADGADGGADSADNGSDGAASAEADTGGGAPSGALAATGAQLAVSAFALGALLLLAGAALTGAARLRRQQA